ncbi:MAG: SlyX family protein [Treponema sp.]|nr:SlyX family protein [Treponema sp.]MDE7383822.1 SlyX family protein [Treponemataceae bacterium]
MTNDKEILEDFESLEKRITNLEIKFSYLEDFLNQIQEVCTEQTKTISLLKKESRLMAEKLSDLLENAEGEIPNRKPPHY